MSIYSSSSETSANYDPGLRRSPRFPRHSGVETLQQPQQFKLPTRTHADLIFPYLETQPDKIVQDELRRSPPAAAWMLQLYVQSPPSILPLTYQTIFATRTKSQGYASIGWNYGRSDLYFVSISQSIEPKPSSGSGANVPEQLKRNLATSHYSYSLI